MKLNGYLISATVVMTVICSRSPVSAQEVYVQGGTQGGGIGAGLGLSSWAGIHADLNGFNFSHDFKAGGNDFTSQTHIRHAGLYLDLFPFTHTRLGGVRITGGALFTRDRLEGIALPVNGFYQVGPYKVPEQLLAGQQAVVTARFPTVMPYLGIGWGHQPLNKGWGLLADMGVAYGRPIVGFSIPLPMIAARSQAVQDEENSVRDKLRRYRLYPVVQLGVTYRF